MLDTIEVKLKYYQFDAEAKKANLNQHFLNLTFRYFNTKNRKIEYLTSLGLLYTTLNVYKLYRVGTTYLIQRRGLWYQLDSDQHVLLTAYLKLRNGEELTQNYA